MKELLKTINPFYFKANSIVKMFIASETLFWSSWNFVAPIFAVFVVADIKGGNIKVVAISTSVYLLMRIFGELLSGRILTKAMDLYRLFLAVLGMLLISIGYFGFALSTSVTEIFIYYVLVGLGFGISAPARYSLFSIHLDKHHESAEWSMSGTAMFVGMAITSAIGGFIADTYGFKLLFLFASLFNLLAIVPYLIYNRKHKGHSHYYTKS